MVYLKSLFAGPFLHIYHFSGYNAMKRSDDALHAFCIYFVKMNSLSERRNTLL